MSADLEKSKLWKQCRALIQTLDTVGRSLPAYEVYTITDQMHRSAVSLAADVAMIVGKGDKDSLFDYRMARGRLLSIKNFILVSQDYGYVEDASGVLIDIETIKRQMDDKITELQEIEDEKETKKGDGDEV
jgi:four helix bundle protein